MNYAFKMMAIVLALELFVLQGCQTTVTRITTDISKKNVVKNHNHALINIKKKEFTYHGFVRIRANNAMPKYAIIGFNTSTTFFGKIKFEGIFFYNQEVCNFNAKGSTK